MNAEIVKGPRASLRRLVLRGFGSLPKPVRRFIVRRFTPSWTAGAVALIERDDGRWLLVRPVYRKSWAVPGGLIDRGEGPEEALRRELLEELGIDVVLDSEPWVIYNSDLRRLDAVFRARLVAGTDPDAIKICSSELIDLRWFHPDDMPQLEDEARDVLTLRNRILDGGGRVLLR